VTYDKAGRFDDRQYDGVTFSLPAGRPEIKFPPLSQANQAGGTHVQASTGTRQGDRSSGWLNRFGAGADVG
jgi:hypothetical protein